MSATTPEAGAYLLREATRDFISLTGGGLITLSAFEVVYRDQGRDTPTGIDRVAKSEKPLHIAAAKRAAEAQARNLTAYAKRIGVRWEVEQQQKRDAKQAAEKAAAEARQRIRKAGPAMLATLQRFLEVFPDPIICDGARLRQDQVAALNGMIVDANAAVALATGAEG